MKIDRRGFFKAALVGLGSIPALGGETPKRIEWSDRRATTSVYRACIGSQNGWLYSKKVYKHGVAVLKEDDFVPYRTIGDCEIIERKFYSDSGDVKDLPRLINFYEGLASNMETGEVKYIKIGKRNNG